MKVSDLEQVIRGFMDGPYPPVVESLNGTRVLQGHGLAEFADAANTLAERVEPTSEDPTTPLNWI